MVSGGFLHSGTVFCSLCRVVKMQSKFWNATPHGFYINTGPPALLDTLGVVSQEQVNHSLIYSFVLSLKMQYQLIASVLAGLTLVNAAPNADALPWAKANPQANAAAQAYADAYAEAEAIGHADPEAYALAASADDCASIACHASCGLLIIEGQKCSQNTENSYKGPYDNNCLCSSGSSFNQYAAPCLDCGWTLWKYYGIYVEDALAACGLNTEPTGTARCSTTLTDEYTPDFNIDGCSYLGNCGEETTSAKATSTAAQAETTSAKATSSAAQAGTTTSSAAQETSTTAAGNTSTSKTVQETSTRAAQETTSEAAKHTSVAENSSAAAAKTTASAAGENTTAKGTTSAAPTVAKTSAHVSSTAATVATFEGAANKVTGFAAAVAAVGLSFLI